VKKQPAFLFDEMAPMPSIVELQRSINNMNSLALQHVVVIQTHRHSFTEKALHDWGPPWGVRRVYRCVCGELRGRA
jgi:hypothetical protein